jgi:signal transduction histidine kinase
MGRRSGSCAWQSAPGGGSQCRSVQRILISATIIIAFTILLAAAISDRTTRPVRELTRAVHQLTAGQPAGVPIPADRDEVGQLTQAFNVMSAQLSEQIQALQAESARLSAVLQKMTDGVLIVDQAGRIQLINPVAESCLTSMRLALRVSLVSDLTPSSSQM